jgi:CheY-like chemotaxis protein
MKSILVVEDEYGNAEVLQLLLESAGYRVRLASNGREALEAIAQEMPDVVLSDYMMPRMTGAELGAALRADARSRQLPLIVMSGTEEQVIAEHFVDYDAFLRKPFSGEQMLALVGKLAESGRPAGLTEGIDQIDEKVRELLRGLSARRQRDL